MIDLLQAYRSGLLLYRCATRVRLLVEVTTKRKFEENRESPNRESPSRVSCHAFTETPYVKEHSRLLLVGNGESSVGLTKGKR